MLDEESKGIWFCLSKFGKIRRSIAILYHNYKLYLDCEKAKLMANE